MKTMLMQNLGGQTKSIMVFSEVAYNYHFSFQEQYFVIPLRIKRLNAQQKRVNTLKGRTLEQQVNKIEYNFSTHVLALNE